MEDELRKADFIILICTPSYNERYAQEGDPKIGLGSRWEASLVRDMLYNTPPDQLSRFMPVLPRNSTVDDIPLPLRSRVTHHQLSDFDGIVRHLNGVPPIAPVPMPPDPGDARARRRRSAGDDDTSPRFAASIREHHLRINRRVEELTHEQYEVIEQLHGRRRVLISGPPGSGKTLVGAEKALRLARAGVHTLFLCHNPLLADWVTQLTSESRVVVRAFETLIRELAPGGDSFDATWSEYSSPTSEQLQAALESLESLESPPYQAVIVDEGQDFEDDWWQVVEACLPAEGGILYVFFDERQSLLPYRLNIPPAGWPLSLSKNCRNAGRIYDVMRSLSPTSPLPDEVLRDLGHVKLFQSAKLRTAVTAAIRWCVELGALDDFAAIVGGGVDFNGSILSKGPFVYGDPIAWQDLVRAELRKLAKGWSSQLRAKDLDPSIVWTVPELSTGSTPSKKDCEVVAEAANAIASALPAKAQAFKRPAAIRWRPIPVASTGAINWRLRSPSQKTYQSEALNALRCDAWASTLPVPESVSFAPHYECEPPKLPVYSLGEIKGLERKAALLVMQGDAPKFMHQLFVGVSRPRAILAIVGDARTFAALPPSLLSMAQVV
jgi:hypothetical protein